MRIIISRSNLSRFLTYKWVCSFCVVLSVLALLLAVSNPAVGYEISIYASTPLAVWGLIIFNIVACVLLLVREASQEKASRRWLFALGILMVNGIMVLGMSVLRDYYTFGRDTLMHIGYIKDLANGIISKQNIYPVVHVIPASLVLIGVSPSVATNLSPVFWYLIYVASFYGLARVIWVDRSKVIIATALSAVLLLPHGVGLAATLVAASMFPITLLVLLKLRRDFKIKYIVAFLGLLAIISLLHPLALEVAFIALIVACVIFAENRWKLVGLTVILLPIAVWWYGYWYDLNVVQVLLKDILGGTTPSVSLPPAIGMAPPQDVIPPQMVEESGRMLMVLPSPAGVEATQTVGKFSGVSLLLRRYGSEILFGLLAIISLVIIAQRYIARSSQNIRYVYFGSLFIVFNVMWLMGWYLQLDVFNAALTRILNWVPVVSIVLVTSLIVRLLSLQKMRRLAVIAVSIIVAVISSCAIFNLYPSPITGVESLQVTHQEIKGIDWLVKNGDPSNYIVHLNSQRVSRYIAAMYGVAWVRENQRYYWLSEFEERNCPFSYNDHLSIGEEYGKDVYVVVTKLDRELPRWKSDKLYMIESDPTTILIYQDSDEFEVWYVENQSLGEK